MDSVASLTEFAPAKVNLALHVTGQRADGFHLIETLAVFTRFGDRIVVAPAETDSLIVDGPYAAGVPMDGGNLVVKARDALRSFALKWNNHGLLSTSPPSVLLSSYRRADISPTGGEIGKSPKLPISPLVGEMSGRTEGGAKERGPAMSPVSIRLTKNLPVASGVGGGSSDAAAALKALAHFWQLGLSPDQLREIGQKLGADVPMCLSARPLIAKGIGEIIEPVADFPALGLVLVNPGVAVSTAEVFAALSNRDNAPLPPLPGALDFHGLRNWLELTRNDLEPAARVIQPAIGAALAALNRADAGFARMSGSGATCFGLFETGNVAKRAAAVIRARRPGWFVAATRAIASEDHAHGQD